MRQTTRMNSKQFAVVVAAIFLFCISELFPPWFYEDGYDSAKRSAGYHFVNSPPSVKTNDKMRSLFRVTDQESHHTFSVRQDMLRLYAQRIAIPFMAIGLLFAFSGCCPLIKLALGSASIFVGCAFAVLVVFLSWSVTH